MSRHTLSRRERQIMDVLYRRGEATVNEVRRELPDPPTDAAVRSALNLLEQKGEVVHRRRGLRNHYRPSVAKEQAAHRALGHLVRTFFEGSRTLLLNALLNAGSVSRADLDRMEEMIRRARLDRDEAGGEIDEGQGSAQGRESS